MKACSNHKSPPPASSRGRKTWMPWTFAAQREEMWLFLLGSETSIRTVLKICIRYLTFESAMKVCSELGDRNSHLVPFNGFEEYEYFYKKSRYICRSYLSATSVIRNSQSSSFTVLSQCLTIFWQLTTAGSIQRCKDIATMETGRYSGFLIKTGELGLMEK